MNVLKIATFSCLLLNFIALPIIGKAEEFHVLDIEEVKTTYINFFPGGRDPLITSNGLDNRQLGQMLDLSLTTSILQYGYLRSLIHSYTDSYADTNSNGQFRSVGLNMELGVHLFTFLDVFVWHYSQHILDAPALPGGFPLQNGVGINLFLFRREQKNAIVDGVR